MKDADKEIENDFAAHAVDMTRRGKIQQCDGSYRSHGCFYLGNYDVKQKKGLQTSW